MKRDAFLHPPLTMSAHPIIVITQTPFACRSAFIIGRNLFGFDLYIVERQCGEL
jgi:hypothetical protein